MSDKSNRDSDIVHNEISVESKSQYGQLVRLKQILTMAEELGSSNSLYMRQIRPKKKKKK
jgi:hypothetical protein